VASGTKTNLTEKTIFSKKKVFFFNFFNLLMKHDERTPIDYRGRYESVIPFSKTYYEILKIISYLKYDERYIEVRTIFRCKHCSLVYIFIVALIVFSVESPDEIAFLVEENACVNRHSFRKPFE